MSRSDPSDREQDMNYFVWTFHQTQQQGKLIGAPKGEGGEEIDFWAFLACKAYQAGPRLLVSTSEDGEVSEASFGAFDLLYVNGRIANVLKNVAERELQFVPVEVEGRQEPYFIVNALTERDCVDEAASEFTKWKSGEGRDDKVGQYKGFFRLRVDPTRASGGHIFRLRGWHMALVVSQTLRDALLDAGLQETVFLPV